MIQVNLLPWRQQARQIKKMRLAFCAAIAGIVSLLIICMLHHSVTLTLDYQQARNDFIQDEIKKEEAALDVLNKEMQEHIAYEDKIRSMLNIKKENYNAIRLLNVLPGLSTSSISITEISRLGSLVTITGKAASNTEITVFMNNIQNQETIFNEPSLATISASKESGYFQVKVVQKDMS